MNKSLWGNECFLWWGKKKETDKNLFKRKTKVLKRLKAIPKIVPAKQIRVFGKFNYGGQLWIRSLYRGKEIIVAPESGERCIIGVRTGNITLIMENNTVEPMNLRQVKTDWL